MSHAEHSAQLDENFAVSVLEMAKGWGMSGSEVIAALLECVTTIGINLASDSLQCRTSNAMVDIDFTVGDIAEEEE